MDLFILIRIIPEIPAFPPDWMDEIKTRGILTFDIDVHSSPEVLQVARQAIERAERVVSYFSVEDHSQESDRIAPVIKDLVRKGDDLLWLQSGYQEFLERLGKRAKHRKLITDIEEMQKSLQEFLT